MNKNTTAARRIENVECLGQGEYSSEPEERATDIMTDLLHFCDVHGVDFDATLERAQTHFRLEAGA